MSSNPASDGYMCPYCVLLKLFSQSSHSNSDNRLTKFGSNMLSMLAAFYVINHRG